MRTASSIPARHNPAQPFTLVLLVVSATSLYSQQSIVGSVEDAVSGEPLGGASVEITSEQSERLTQSGIDGSFSLQDLPPGPLEVTVSKDGYAPERVGLTLEPRQSAMVEVLLRPAGGQSETIEVTGTVEVIGGSRAQTAVALTRSDIENLPGPYSRDIPRMVAQVVPGAVLGHDNFIHLKGNELSMHQFVDGVAFLDNANTHFTPGGSPQVFASVNIITGGIPAEFGNRLGGVLDIVTKSGRDFQGGSLTLGGGTIVTRDAALEYGFGRRKWDAYFFSSGFSDGRFLNPPQEREIHDLGYGARSFFKLGYNPSDHDRLSLLFSGSGANFQLPNTTSDLLEGRDSLRRTRQGSAVLRWQRTLSPNALVTSSVYNRYVSDRLVGTTDLVTPMANGFRRTQTNGAKVDVLVHKGRHTIKAGVDTVVFSLNEDLLFDPRTGDAHDEEEEHGHEGGKPEDAHGEEGHGAEVRRTPFVSAIGAQLSSAGLFGGAFRSPIHSEAVLPTVNFRGRRRGGQGSFYVQDQFSPFPNFTVHAGIRYDRYSVVVTEDLWSPRLGLSYHIPKTGTVVRAIYNRYFVPPPLEYVQLGSALGAGIVGLEEAHHEEDSVEEEHHAVGPLITPLVFGLGGILSGDEAGEHHEEEAFNPGPVRSLTQHYFEFGVQQRLHDKVVLDISGYHHQGRNAFENAELSNTRLFIPVNFDRERTWGTDFSLRLRPLDRIGLFGYLNYSHINTSFFGPVSGGLGGDHSTSGERILPAYDQRHTGTASIGYRHDRSGFIVGMGAGYGSGTPAELPHVDEHGPEVRAATALHGFPGPILSGGGEQGTGAILVRLPQHWTFDLWTGITMWKSETRSLDLQFNLENAGNRIYGIAKESAATPIQYAGRRRFSGQLKYQF